MAIYSILLYKIEWFIDFSDQFKYKTPYSVRQWCRTLEIIVQIRDGELYRDFKVQVLLEEASLFNARGLCNPGKVRRRVFELTSQTLPTSTVP